MSKRTMGEVVAEYNKLTGQSIKRFATVEVGEKRIAAAKAGIDVVIKPQPVPTKKKATSNGSKQRITVDGVPHRSVFTAFEVLKLPINKHIKFRGELKAAGHATFEHAGKKYKFIVVKQQELV